MLEQRFRQDLLAFLSDRGLPTSELETSSKALFQWKSLLFPLLQAERALRIEEVVSQRSSHIIPVLDQIYDYGNINAVMRSAEGMGFCAIDLINSQSEFRLANRYSAGADKWLSLRRHSHASSCLESLKRQGFKVLATDLTADVSLDQWDWSQATALVLGNEHRGVCPEILEKADARIKIPMKGFTQSFNISVAAALMLREIQRQPSFQSHVGEEEKLLLTLIYALKSLPHPAQLLSGLLQRTELTLKHASPGFSGTSALPGHGPQAVSQRPEPSP